jgi:predicted ATP-dependent endonuclease of OLD family
MVIIEKLKLLNFKRFQEWILTFDKDSNTIIGDNESGKSTVLLALDLVLSGSRTKIDNMYNSYVEGTNKFEYQN